MSGLIGLLISLIVLGLVLACLWWIVNMILPAVPPPFQLAIRVVFALICLLAVLSLLFGGWSFPFYTHPVLR